MSNKWQPIINRSALLHYEALSSLFSGTDNYHNGIVTAVDMYCALHKIEKAMHKLAERYCSIDNLNWETYDKREVIATERVAKILGITVSELEELGFFINRDPKGYALKIKSDKVLGLHQDLGEYYILAPDF